MGGGYNRQFCAKWSDVLGRFVKASVLLKYERSGSVCWARKNGILLLGGYKQLSSQGRFKDDANKSKFLEINQLFLHC